MNVIMINVKGSDKETHITLETTLMNQGRKVIKTYKRIENVIIHCARRSIHNFSFSYYIFLEEELS